MKKTILFILPNLRVGGAERVATLLVNHLDRKRFVPTLLLFQKEGIYLDILKTDVEIIEIKVSRIRYALFKVLKFIKKLQPDIVFSGYGELNTYISPFLPFLKKTKFVARETNVVSQHVQRKEILFFYRFYNNFDKIIAQSDDMKEYLIRNIRIKPEKIIKINNPVDLDFIQEKLKEGREPEEYFAEKKNILAVGSLNHRKGFDDLLKVFAHLKNEPIHLLIIGEGPERENLLKLKKNLGLKNVSFLGIRVNPFIYMKHADLFVLSSRYEGFPNVLLEANACGTPVVANRCKGGINEIVVENINGIITDITQHHLFAKALLKLIKQDFDPKKIQELTRDRFDKNLIVSKYENFFDSL